MAKIIQQKSNWYRAALPLVFFIAFINWHYFGFYRHHFQIIFQNLNLKPTLTKNLYEQTQKYHPYQALYLGSIEYAQKPVFYLYSRFDPQNKIATDELELRVNYFFYPRIIKALHNKKLFLKTLFPKGSLIISDQELLKPNLKWLNPHKDVTLVQDYFFQQEKPYFLYEQQ